MRCHHVYFAVAVYGALGLATGFIVQLIGGTFVQVDLPLSHCVEQESSFVNIPVAEGSEKCVRFQIVFSILGTTAGPLVGLYLLGGLWPRAGARV